MTVTLPRTSWRSRTRPALLALAALATLPLSGLANDDPPPPAVASDLQIERFLGKWYEIASIPKWFNSEMVDLELTYTRTAEQEIRIDYRYREETLDAELETTDATAKVPDLARPANWLLKPVFFITVDYWILALGPDYQWALVGHPGRKSLWLLARQPLIDEATYQAMLQAARDRGYDVALLRRMPQNPAGER